MYTDYRLPEHREKYFTELYQMNLEHKVMPGLVYLYLPELAAHYSWDEEQKLWFAFLNGLTQSPITTLRMFNQQPTVPTDRELLGFALWFNAQWATLHFDADRLKNKRNTLPGISSYLKLVAEFGTQQQLWTGSYPELWSRAQRIYSMGRLSCFSYLEFVHIMGHGAKCTDLMLTDKEGSRSHRNGLLFLLGRDDLVWDKRANNGCAGKYGNFEQLCAEINAYAEHYLTTQPHPDAGNFTFESQCCQFKNGFFGRRYPGVYADMAWDRIKWYDERKLSVLTQVFKDIREEHLPAWLREEVLPAVKRSDKAQQFILTGTPYNGQHFMEEGR